MSMRCDKRSDNTLIVKSSPGWSIDSTLSYNCCTAANDAANDAAIRVKTINSNRSSEVPDSVAQLL